MTMKYRINKLGNYAVVYRYEGNLCQYWSWPDKNWVESSGKVREYNFDDNKEWKKATEKQAELRIKKGIKK